MLPSLGRFDLVFADAQGGKWERLDLTIGTLRKGGFLLADDMTPTLEWEEEQAEKQSQVRDELHGHSDLIACDIDWATGLILCVRRH
jgi:demethylmenaquinone methyltransferase/2-methoxy-6-polyprenyl-1,4-benzoquinol methylase